MTNLAYERDASEENNSKKGWSIRTCQRELLRKVQLSSTQVGVGAGIAMAILRCIDDRSAGSGVCTASARTLSLDSCFPQRTVERTLKGLKSAGLIDGNKSNSTLAVVYQIRWSTVANLVSQKLFNEIIESCENQASKEWLLATCTTATQTVVDDFATDWESVPTATQTVGGTVTQTVGTVSLSVPTATQTVGTASQSDISGIKKEEKHEVKQEVSKRKKSGSGANVDSHFLSIPKELDTQDFRNAWKEWITHLKQKRKSPTEKTIELNFKRLRVVGAEKAIEWIHNSIEKGWAGIYEPSTQSFKKSSVNNGPGINFEAAGEVTAW